MATSEVHEPTQECLPDHCFWCHVDEPISGGESYYIICGECWHVYRTAKELRREKRKRLWKMYRQTSHWPRPLIFSNRFEPSRLEVLWRILTVRVEDIYGCQKCSHNF